MTSSGTANTGDASNIHPTEAQLRWAQFHHKRRARGVKLSIAQLHKTPQNVDDVDGAYPEDGNSTTSISEAEIRERRPKVSRGRRALLRVSRRKYKQRSQTIKDEGFRRLQGVETFSDGEDDDDLNDIFMTKRKRRRRRTGEDDERLKRFEDACHAMMMSLAQPEQQQIVIPTKRWTRTADHIAASAMLEEEYLDPKWGIRRRTLDVLKDRDERQFNLQHRATTPVDTGASWLMHLPTAIPSSRDNPSSNFFIQKRPGVASGLSVDDGISEGGQSVSTLAMKAPGQQKFNQLVALAQRHLIDQQRHQPKDSTRFNAKIRQNELLHSTDFQRRVPPEGTRSVHCKPPKSYMPRMRHQDFTGSTNGDDDAGNGDELTRQEVLALNQIPRDRYLEALRLQKNPHSISRESRLHHSDMNTKIPTVALTLTFLQVLYLSYTLRS